MHTGRNRRHPFIDRYIVLYHPLHGETGIAHTRWATHGAPTVGNAHPHIVGPIALVHNGIIENFKSLRDELIADGRLATAKVGRRRLVPRAELERLLAEQPAAK